MTSPLPIDRLAVEAGILLAVVAPARPPLSFGSGWNGAATQIVLYLYVLLFATDW